MKTRMTTSSSSVPLVNCADEQVHFTTSSLAPFYYEMRGYLFLVWMFVLYFLLLGPVTTVLGPVLILLDKRRTIFHRFASIWGYLVVRPFYSVKVVNSENLASRKNGKGVIFVANHSSHTDVWSLLFLWRDLAFLSKKELLDIPLLGWWCRLRGDIPIKRDCAESRRLSMEVAKQRLDAGMSIVIFPEGTRSEDGRLLAFKDGAFRLAMESGCAIQPITILGARAIAPRGSAKLKRGTVTLLVHPAISPEGKDTEVLKFLARNAIERSLPMLSSHEGSKAT